MIDAKEQRRAELRENQGWIGVDLDGTLAHYDGQWQYEEVKIGAPIEPMLIKVRLWINHGCRVKIFTARADHPASVVAIKKWLDDLGLGDLEITNVKDRWMYELYDDRAYRVIMNTGMIVGER